MTSNEKTCDRKNGESKTSSTVLFNDEFCDYFSEVYLEISPEIVWKRPVQVANDPCLLEQHDNEIDGYIVRGAFTPRWFPVLLIMLKRHRMLNLIMRNIKDQDNFNRAIYDGSFVFSFFRENRWIDVHIDDKLPYQLDNNKPLFCASSNKEEFFPSLVEKAFARLCQGYDKLEKVSFIDGLMTFTGGIVDHLPLQRNLECLPGGELKKIFLKTKSVSSDTIVICDSSATMVSSISNVDTEDRNGLLPEEHYYLVISTTSLPQQHGSNILGTIILSLIDSDSSSSIDLVRVHNPVMSGDWQGPYSVGSMEWDSINEMVRRRYSLKFSHEFEFWISIDDLTKNMCSMTICHIPQINLFQSLLNKENLWYPYFLNGQYLLHNIDGGIDAGGKYFLRNHQYLIDIPNQKNCNLKVVLFMESRQSNIQFNDECGLTFLKVENNRYLRLKDINNSIILTSTLLSQCGYIYTTYIDLSRGKYIMLPWRNGSTDVIYYIRVYSNIKSVAINLLDNNYPVFEDCFKCSFLRKLTRTKSTLSKTPEVTSYDNIRLKTKCASCVAINPSYALRVTVLSASNIESNTDKSKRTTYFLLKWKNFSYKSNIKQVTSNPVWNEDFVFYRRSNDSDYLSIEIFSTESFGFDKSLGVHIFRDYEMKQEIVEVPLNIYVNKEWVMTSSKIRLKFRTYTSSEFDFI